MQLNAQIKDLIAYDYWANTKIISATLSVARSEWHEKIPKIMSHLLAAQEVWLERLILSGVRPEVFPDTHPEVWQSQLDNYHKRLMDYVDFQFGSLEDEIIHYKDSKGKAYSQPASEILIHLTHHGAYHRGQVVVLLRPFLDPPPVTDFIFYLREKKR